MSKIKTFDEFVNETYLDEPSDPEILKHNKKKMLKNGYINVTIDKPVKDVDEDEVLFVSATEFGQLSDDAIVTCLKKDGEEVLIPKNNLKIKK